MSTYKVAKDGYLFGSFVKAGTEMNLHEKQAKYPVLSGQLEPVGKKSASLDAPKKATSMPPKKDYERSSKRTVGGSFGGDFSKGH